MYNKQLRRGCVSMNIDTLNNLLLSQSVLFAKMRSEKRQGLYNTTTVQCTYVDVKFHLMYLLSCYIAPWTESGLLNSHFYLLSQPTCGKTICFICMTDSQVPQFRSILNCLKVSKSAKMRNRYNQVQHLTQVKTKFADAVSAELGNVQLIWSVNHKESPKLG